MPENSGERLIKTGKVGEGNSSLESMIAAGIDLKKYVDNFIVLAEKIKDLHTRTFTMDGWHSHYKLKHLLAELINLQDKVTHAAYHCDLILQDDIDKVKAAEKRSDEFISKTCECVDKISDCLKDVRTMAWRGDIDEALAFANLIDERKKLLTEVLTNELTGRVIGNDTKVGCLYED